LENKKNWTPCHQSEKCVKCLLFIEVAFETDKTSWWRWDSLLILNF